MNHLQTEISVFIFSRDLASFGAWQIRMNNSRNWLHSPSAFTVVTHKCIFSDARELNNVLIGATERLCAPRQEITTGINEKMRVHSKSEGERERWWDRKKGIRGAVCAMRSWSHDLTSATCALLAFALRIQVLECSVDGFGYYYFFLSFHFHFDLLFFFLSLDLAVARCRAVSASTNKNELSCERQAAAHKDKGGIKIISFVSFVQRSCTWFTISHELWPLCCAHFLLLSLSLPPQAMPFGFCFVRVFCVLRAIMFWDENARSFICGVALASASATASLSGSTNPLHRVHSYTASTQNAQWHTDATIHHPWRSHFRLCVLLFILE